MNKNLYIIFLLVLVFRLFFAFQSEEFNDDNAYFTLRNVESIQQTGKPLFNDELSYGGRQTVFLPLYYYILAAFYSVFGELTFKIITSILFSSLIFLVYLIVKEFTNNEEAALLATLISAFIPVFISTTTNNISIYSAALFVMLLMILSLIKIKDKKYMNLFIGLAIAFPLLHGMAFLFILSLLTYLILSIAESNKLEKVKKEAILFSLFIVLTISFLLFKDAFLLHGLNIIYQNIPNDIISNYFKGINIIDLIFNFGLIPIFFGIFGLSYSIRKKDDNTILLGSMILTTSVLLIFRLIDVYLAFIFLGILLSILSSIGFEKLFKYITMTKFSRHLNRIKFSIFILAILLMIVPSFIEAKNSTDNALSKEEFDALLWLSNNTETDSIVMSSYDEGHFITKIAKRKNVIDDNFLLANNINQRYNDVKTVFTTTSQVKALQVLKKYDVTYVYFSERTKQIYNSKEIAYSDDKCFKEVYRTEKVRIYKVRC